MKWSDFDKWLCGKHLQGRPATLTIREIVIEDVYQQTAKGKVRTPVAYFKETTKGLVLTPTNQDKLEALFGDAIAACAGQRIIIEPVELRVGGQDRLVVRITGKGAPPKPSTNGHDPDPQSSPAS
jgi:hypothetical protein